MAGFHAVVLQWIKGFLGNSEPDISDPVAVVDAAIGDCTLIINSMKVSTAHLIKEQRDLQDVIRRAGPEQPRPLRAIGPQGKLPQCEDESPASRLRQLKKVTELVVDEVRQGELVLDRLRKAKEDSLASENLIACMRLLRKEVANVSFPAPTPSSEGIELVRTLFEECLRLGDCKWGTISERPAT